MLQNFNPKNADLLVNINGEIIHRDRAGVSPFDAAALPGPHFQIISTSGPPAEKRRDDPVPRLSN
jgi:hypothetical protein